MPDRSLLSYALSCLARVSLGVVVLALAGCGEKVLADKIELTMMPGSFMPSRTMEISEANKFPQQNLGLMAEEWEQLQKERYGLEVDVKFIYAPSQQQQDFLMWMNMQHLGNVAPDMFVFFAGDESLRQKNWIRPVEQYLDDPNPYAPGNREWRNLFLDAIWDPQWQHLDGKWYYISVDYFETILYYNKDAFRKAGITNPQPATWAEFDRMQEKLREAGYIPFYGDAMWSWWPRGLLCDMLMREKYLPLLDVLKPDGFVNIEEAMRGYYKGIITFHTPEMKEYLRLMKDWVRHWPRNWKGANPSRLFIRGQQALHWSTAWNITSIERDPERDFEYGTIYFPPLTKETTPFASDPPIEPGSVGAPGSSIYLNSSPRLDQQFETDAGKTVSREELIIDWLMYLTSPEGNERLTLEETAVQRCPAVKGVPVPEEMEVLYDIIARGPVKRLFVWGPSMEAAENQDRIFELYLLGEEGYDLERTVAEMHRWFEKGLEESIRENQEGPEEDRWDLDSW